MHEVSFALGLLLAFTAWYVYYTHTRFRKMKVLFSNFISRCDRDADRLDFQGRLYRELEQGLAAAREEQRAQGVQIRALQGKPPEELRPRRAGTADSNEGEKAKREPNVWDRLKDDLKDI